MAAIDRSDPDHLRCRDLLAAGQEARIIPAPVLVELDYWCRAKSSVQAFVGVLDDIQAGAFRVESLTDADYRRVRALQLHSSG